MKAPDTTFDRAHPIESTGCATVFSESTPPLQPVGQLHDILGVDDAEALVIVDATNTRMSKPMTGEFTLLEERGQKQVLV